MPVAPGHRVIIPEARNTGAGLGALAAAVVTLIAAGALALDPVVGAGARVVVGLGGLLLTSALALIGVRLLAGPGGLRLDPAGGRGEGSGGRLGLGLTGRGDVWWLPVATVSGVRVQPTDHRRDGESYRLWTALLDRPGEVAIVLTESPDHDYVEVVADDLASEAGLARCPADGEGYGDPAATGEAAFGVRRGAALQGVLALFGASMALVGGALFTVVGEHPVFGLFFAPLLALLGLALLVVPLVKALATEELLHDGGRWTHRYRLGPLRWGERTVTAPRPQWRLRLQALRGATLELVGDDGTLVMGSGATTRSHMDVTALTALPRHFATSLKAPRPPDPPRPA